MLPRAILIVDDQVLLARSLARALRGTIKRVFVSHNIPDAQTILARERLDAIVTDERLGDDQLGSTLLEEVAARQPQMRRVLMSGVTTLSTGHAHATLPKPFPLEALLDLLSADYGPEEHGGEIK